jgi:NAD(P)-dependent dehydrogenase (short-subunit alcohol dehydrogenase family)
MSVESLFSCHGKVALITGAAAGIGLAIAEVMADAGASLACVDRDSHALRAAVDALTVRGAKAIAIVCDVTKEDQVEQAVAQTVRELGALDILFNNAGVAQAPQEMHELSTEEWSRVIDVDLHGSFFFAREALKVMVPRSSGKIINIASIYGLVGSSGFVAVPAYNAAKGAMVNLTREMGRCYAPHGINVNCICPGFIETGFGGKDATDDPAALEQLLAFVPMGRPGTTEEIKGLALLLASRASDYMCGCNIPVDGGAVAR